MTRRNLVRLAGLLLVAAGQGGVPGVAWASGGNSGDGSGGGGSGGGGSNGGGSNGGGSNGGGGGSNGGGGGPNGGGSGGGSAGGGSSGGTGSNGNAGNGNSSNGSSGNGSSGANSGNARTGFDAAGQGWARRDNDTPRGAGQPASLADRTRRDQSPQNRAQDAVASGQAAPLNQVLATIRRTVPGDVMAVALEERAAGWTYFVTILTEQGEYCDVTVDARRNRLTQLKWR